MNASCIEQPAFGAGNAHDYVRDTIAPAVAARYGVPLDCLTGTYDEADLDIVWPRCVSAWLAHELTGVAGYSLAGIFASTPGGFRHTLGYVERVFESFPEIKESLFDFYREIHLPGSCLIGKINDLDRTVRRLEAGGCNGGL